MLNNRTTIARQIWEKALEQLRHKVTPGNYHTWLKSTVGLSYHNQCFIVGVPSTFANEWVGKRLQPLIKQTLAGITGENVEVTFQVSPGGGAGAVAAAAPVQSTERVICLPPRFNPKYTFSAFVVGDSNRVAHAAALTVAEKPGDIYNPLFIYSGVGLGKTHLMHAIGWEVRRTYPTVMYVSAEQFTNEFVTSIRDRKTEEFRSKYRSVDVLLIDDVQFIAGKEQTQESLFHTFNDLHNSGRQIVISSDRHPRSLTLLEDRLQSRFEWGLTVDMQAPNLETRLAILQKKAEEHRTVVPPEVLDLIARKCQKNIREIEGALNRVIAYARLTKVPLTTEVATQALIDIAGDSNRRNISPAAIINTVAAFYVLDVETLRGKKRDKPISQARQMAMYLLREELRSSWSDIARELGGKDHSTIIYGHKRMTAEISADFAIRRDLLEIRERLYSKP